MWGGLMSKRATTKSMGGLEPRKQNFVTLNIEFISSKAISKHENAQAVTLSKY